jgi:hypothetical protein
MSPSINWRTHLGYSLVAAILYCIPVVILLLDSTFSMLWLLYVGNFLFLITLVVFLFAFNNHRNEDASSMAMMTASAVTAAVGIILAFLICLLLLFVMVPGLFHAGTADKVLLDAPTATVGAKTHGLLFAILASAILGNFVVSMFVSIIFPFTLKGNQTRGEGKVSPNGSEKV